MKQFIKCSARVILDFFWRVRVRSSLVACGLCGSRQLSTEDAYGRLFVICGNCRGVQAREIPEFIQLIGMGIDGSWGGALQGGEREHYLAHLVKSMTGAETYLLYGSGATRAPLALRREGFAAWALDVSHSAVKCLNDASESDVAFTHKTLPPGRRFDAIVACEVFEHFNDPIRWFGYINELVANHGLICGTTDFYGGRDIYEGDGRPGYMSLLGHTFYWSQESMEWLALRFQMKFISFEMESPGSKYPDKRYGLLFPNKRVFFLTRNEDTYKKLKKLKEMQPMLPLDTRDYWDRCENGHMENPILAESPVVRSSIAPR